MGAMEQLDFTSLAPKQQDVILPGSFFPTEKEKVRTCLLREVSAEGARLFMNAKLSSFKINDEGRMIGVGNAADLQGLIVHLSLYERNGDGVLRNVPKTVIAEMPGSVVAQLADAAHKLSKEALREDKPDRTKLISVAVDLLSEIAEVKVGEDHEAAASALIEEVVAAFKSSLPERPTAKKFLSNGTTTLS